MRLGAAEEEGDSVVPGALSLPTRQAQPVFFGEVSEAEFQEAITLVETSFLWPGLVTRLGRDPRQAGWSLGNCCHPCLPQEAEEGGVPSFDSHNTLHGRLSFSSLNRSPMATGLLPRHTEDSRLWPLNQGFSWAGEYPMPCRGLGSIPWTWY